MKSAGAFVGYLLGVWFFEPWMITFGLLFPFIGNIVLLTVTGGWIKEHEEGEEEEDDEGGEAKGDEGEKKSLKEKMQASHAGDCTANSGFLECLLGTPY